MRFGRFLLICFSGLISLAMTGGELIILVTHLVTISAMANEGVSSGEGVLLELKNDAPYEVVGRLNFSGSSF